MKKCWLVIMFIAGWTQSDAMEKGWLLVPEKDDDESKQVNFEDDNPVTYKSSGFSGRSSEDFIREQLETEKKTSTQALKEIIDTKNKKHLIDFLQHRYLSGITIEGKTPLKYVRLAQNQEGKGLFQYDNEEDKKIINILKNSSKKSLSQSVIEDWEKEE